MNKYDSAFKAYDIRWIYWDSIDKILFYNLGRGVGQYMIDNFGPDWKFIFWGDGRLANNELITYFLYGMMESGYTNFVSAGLVTELSSDFPQYYYGIASTSTNYYLNYLEFDLGASFTASHNSAKYAGVKIFDTNSSLLSTDLLKDLIDEYKTIELTESDIQKVIDTTKNNTNKQAMLAQKIKNRENNFIKRFSNISSKLKIVVDFSNGAGCSHEKYFLQEIQKNSKIEFIFINNQIDSNFSNHESDTSQVVNYKQLSKAVLDHKADFGIMFDGDVDRIWLTDEKGNFISGDLIIALIIQWLLKDWKETRWVTHDLMCTKSLSDIASKYWVSVTESKVWYKFVKQIAIKNNCCLGWEISGHILFAENWYFENPILALYYICKELTENKKYISHLVWELHPYYKAPQTKYEIRNWDEIIQKIQNLYSDQKISKLDWIKVIAADYRFVVRKSNTEPIIRFCMEADTKDIWYKQSKIIERQLGLN